MPTSNFKVQSRDRQAGGGETGRSWLAAEQSEEIVFWLGKGNLIVSCFRGNFYKEGVEKTAKSRRQVQP